MGSFKEYDRYDATGLAELVQKRQVSPQELVEAAIERIESRNGRLNAVIRPMFEEARKAANGEVPKGPFSGVPMLLKDLLAAYAGVPLTMGCRAYKDYIPDHDSEFVVRLKRAGLLVVGKTNTPEFGLMGITEPKLHGPTRNPWNPDHTPGGSSGGSASAVAAGMTPLAAGGDGGGSIRIPASFCGLFGMKPTRFRNPTGPKLGRAWQGAAVEHVLTRTVRDSAGFLDVTQGGDVGAPFTIPPPARPYREEVGREPGKLRIAFCADSPIGTSVDPENREALMATAKNLERLGHKVEEAAPNLDGQALADSFLSLYFGEVAADIAAVENDTGKKPRRGDFEATTWFLGEMGRRCAMVDFVEAIRRWDHAARVMGQFHEKYDLYMTPTVAAPPARVGELYPKSYEQVGMRAISALRIGPLAKRAGLIRIIATNMLAKTPFTQLANFTGQPAMSVPLAMHKSGLPCGIQFIAPFGDESTLFRLAGQLEKELPWAGRQPARS